MQTIERVLRMARFWLFYFPVCSYIVAYFYVGYRLLWGSQMISFLMGLINPLYWLAFASRWPNGWLGFFGEFSLLNNKALELQVFHIGNYLFYIPYFLFAFKAKYMRRKYLFITAWAIIIFTALSIQGCTNQEIRGTGPYNL